MMLGEFVDDYTVRVVDVFAMPQVSLPHTGHGRAMQQGGRGGAGMLYPR